MIPNYIQNYKRKNAMKEKRKKKPLNHFPYYLSLV